MGKKRIPELKVVFDTSSLFNGSASDLLNSKVSELIISNSNHSDLNIGWYLPETVLQEREYQMISNGLSLLPSIQKLEKLLGHNLNITDKIIKDHIADAINNQLSDFSIHKLPLNTSEVEWVDIMRRASFRLPPFERGEKEKGFRDSLIAESFIQLVSQSPTSPQYCRIALISGDDLLRGYIKERTSSASNVRLLSSIDELKSLINTLVSEVKEELIEQLKPKAASYFFEPDNKATLYYKENIRDKIIKAYTDQLSEKHPDGGMRENGTWYVSSPSFIKKDRQRIYWASIIEVEAKAYKWVKEESSESSTPNKGIMAYMQNKQAYNPWVAATTASLKGRKELYAEGKTVIAVIWSVIITTKSNFSYPKIKGIDFIETTWGNSGD